MKRITQIFLLIGCLIIMISIVSCSETCKNTRGNTLYSFSQIEPQWIRDGEPIVFENESWYPQDDVDILLDEEVYLLGDYKGIQFFIEKADVRPYDRLYTKFAENKFRVYEKYHHD